MLYKIMAGLLIWMVLFGRLWADGSWKIYDDSQVALIQISVDPDDLQWMYEEDNWKSDSLHVATIHFRNALIDEVVDSVGFRLRGNTSRSAQKKSFKVSFNGFISGKKFHDVEKLNLNGEHNDPSVIRSKLCWDFFNKMGVPSSRAAHAAVYINGAYYGLYIMVEHIDEQFLKTRFADAGGNLWKCLWPADLNYRGADAEDYYPFYDDQRPYELKTNKKVYDYKPLAHLIDIINNTPDDLFADSLQANLDVAGVLKYFALNIFSGSWDDYWSLMNNYYVYYEPITRRFHWIPYDYDNTFGVDWFNIDWAEADPYHFPKVNDGPRPLSERMMQNGGLRNLYTHFLYFYLDHLLDLSQWQGRLDSLQDRITYWASIDTFRTLDYGFTMADFFNSYDRTDYSNQHVKYSIKEFALKRAATLRDQLDWQQGKPVIYDLTWYPHYPLATDTIYIEAAGFSHAGLTEVTLDLQGRGILPMQYKPLANTTHVEYADRWLGKIPPLGAKGEVHFRIHVLDNDDQETSYPPDKPIFIRVPGESDSALLINEFLAKNDNTNRDSAGEYDDWIELYNPSDSIMPLAGKYLTDSPENFSKWRFPQNAPSVDEHGFVLIWCDDDPGQSGLHTNFKLSAAGEFIGLIAEDGITVIDSITFQRQQADVSFGRYPDGSENWLALKPTPAGSNSPTALTAGEVVRSFDLIIYPNPFNNEAILQYELPQSGKVTIRMYNSIGKSIWTKQLSHQGGGYHQLKWAGKNNNGRAVSSGIFFCQLKFGNRSITKKLILIR